MPDDLVTTTCPDLKCGVRFALPSHVREQTRSYGEKRTVYCPNGHAFHWSELAEDRLKRELDAMTKNRDYHQAESIRLWKQVVYWKGQAHRKPRSAP